LLVTFDECDYTLSQASLEDAMDLKESIDVFFSPVISKLIIYAIIKKTKKKSQLLDIVITMCTSNILNIIYRYLKIRYLRTVISNSPINMFAKLGIKKNMIDGDKHYTYFKGNIISTQMIFCGDKSVLEQMTSADSKSKSYEYKFSTWTRNENYWSDFLKNCTETGNDKIKLYSQHGYNLIPKKTLPKINPHIVVLDENVMQDLLDDVKEFTKSKEWYAKNGIPHRRGYMLYGPPGTGKTSTVYAVASYMNMGIAPITLNDKSTTDQMIYLFEHIPKNTIVVIEDIDATAMSQSRDSDKTNINLSILLNLIDGFAANDHILFMTTNHIENLDPALIRPGRIDRKIYLGPCSDMMIGKLVKKFYPDIDSMLIEEFVKACNGIIYTPATIQQHLLLFKNNPNDALAHFQKLQTDNQKQQ